MGNTMKQQILAALRDAGFDLSLWYDRSAKQWVFTGPSTENWYQTGTCIYRLDDLTVDQWVELANIYTNHQQ